MVETLLFPCTGILVRVETGVGEGEPGGRGGVACVEDGADPLGPHVLGGDGGGLRPGQPADLLGQGHARHDPLDPVFVDGVLGTRLVSLGQSASLGRLSSILAQPCSVRGGPTTGRPAAAATGVGGAAQSTATTTARTTCAPPSALPASLSFQLAHRARPNRTIRLWEHLRVAAGGPGDVACTKQLR